MNKPRIRASSVPQLLYCFGSRTLQEIVTPIDHGDGWEGVALHWEIAWKLVRELGAEQPEGGILKADVPPGYKIPKASAWMIDWCFNHVKHNYSPTWALNVETELAYEFDKFVLVGHMDVHGVNSDASDFRGTDWKSGTKPVPPAQENDQVLAYLSLSSCAYPGLNHALFDIGQPRLNEEDGIPRISTVELDRNGIQRCVSSLNDRINEALLNPLLLNTGVLQCAWCTAILQCEAIRQHKDLMKLLLTPEMLAKVKASPDDAQLADIVLASKILDRPFDEAKDALKARIKSKKEVFASDGTRISAKESGGSYKVTDPVGFYKATRALVKDDERFAKSISYPIGRITDAISEEQNIPLGGMQDRTAEKLVESNLLPFATQGTKTTLLFT